MRHLEYVMDDAQLAVVPARAGILVRVPDPARFALHKLAVSQRRAAAEAAKTRKDLAQAEAVLSVLRDLRPGDVRMALDAAGSMGTAFTGRMRKAAASLSKETRALLE